MNQKLFVYGTLRKGMINYNKYLKGHVYRVIPAYIKGKMYTINNLVYPAVIEGDEWIIGEIIVLKKGSNKRIINSIDKMEGFHDEDINHSLYDKVEMPVYSKDKKLIDHLNVYIYNIENNTKLKGTLGVPIRNNDYVEYLKSKKN